MQPSKPVVYLLLMVAMLAVLGSCSREPAVAPESVTVDAVAPAFAVNPERLAQSIAERSGWLDATELGGATATSPSNLIVSMDKEMMTGDVAHYSYVVQVGPGTYDQIGLHRVVKEKRPGKPIKAHNSIFLQHGDILGFDKFIFGARTPVLPDDYSLAVFLASNDVDVWGIDQNWVLVPLEVTNHDFMADWGMQNQIDNLKVGIAVARFVRTLTGSGPFKMHLLGYSSGAWTTMAYMNEESQQPQPHRQIGGYIPLDGSYKVDNEAWRIGHCELAGYYQSLIDAGEYGVGDAQFFNWVGELAETAPGDPTPIPDFAGLTNLQVALFFAASPAPPPDWYHYQAATWDMGSGLPVDLTATEIPAWLDFIQLMVPWEAALFQAEFLNITCDEVDMPFDDHLGDITVPVFYVGAAGGIGESGLYQLGLLGSTDVTTHMATLNPPVDPFSEFGHIDLLSASMVPNDALTNVWMPMLNWIEDHAPQDHGTGLVWKEVK